MYPKLEWDHISTQLAEWSLKHYYGMTPPPQKKEKTSKTGLQRPAARYDGIGKIGGGYGFMVSRVVSRCPWLPSWGPW